METEEKTYEITKVNCEKDGCNKSFDVVVSPILTPVASPVDDTKFSLQRQQVTSGIIVDYIVVKCPCGHTQRVYLKKK